MRRAILNGYVGFYMQFGNPFKEFSTNVTKFGLGSRNINTHERRIVNLWAGAVSYLLWYFSTCTLMNVAWYVIILVLN